SVVRHTALGAPPRNLPPAANVHFTRPASGIHALAMVATLQTHATTALASTFCLREWGGEVHRPHWRGKSDVSVEISGLRCRPRGRREARASSPVPERGGGAGSGVRPRWSRRSGPGAPRPPRGGGGQPSEPPAPSRRWEKACRKMSPISAGFSVW